MAGQSSVPNTVTVTNPGARSSVAGTVVSLQIEASDSFIEQGGVQTLAYAAAGLPPGLSIDSATGLISGTIPDDVAAGFTVTVTAKDTTGASGSAAFTWTVINKVRVANPGPRYSTAGTATSLPIEASSSGFRLTLAYTAAGLPPGLSINRSTGLISGTAPSEAGIYTVTVTAQDTTGASGSVAFEWSIVPSVTVANPGSQASPTDTAVRLQIEASSSSGAPLDYSVLGLPPGLSIDFSTGLISGTTPGKAGTFTVTVTAQDAQDLIVSGSAVFTWNVSNRVTVTNPGNMATPVGQAASLQIAAVGEAPLTYAQAGLPPGLSIDPSTGLISGIVTVEIGAGAYPVTVTAQDPTGSSGSAAFAWIVVNNVAVTNPGTQTSLARTAVSLQIQASDSAAGQSLTYTAANLPPGLSINSATGLISGTTGAAGDFFDVTVTAQDTTGASGAAAFTWFVHNLVSVTNPGTQTSVVGTPVSVQIKASDSVSGQTLTYTAVNLPPGLSINSATGLISGTIPSSTPVGPPATVVVAVHDGTGASGSAVFGWIIHNLVTVTNPGTQNSAADTEVSLQIKASDSATGETLTYTAATLPPGLSINSATGLIFGTTPRTAGSFGVTVTVTDTTGSAGSAAFAWTLHNAVTVTNPGPRTSAVGTPVSVQIQASDSASGQTLTYTAANLPPGLSINRSTGLISGTPNAPGPFAATVTATDTLLVSGSASFTWTVAELG